MPGLVRFGVSLDQDLLKAFDKHIRSRKCPTRSKAIEDLIRADLIVKKWTDGDEDVAGTVTIIYNHHKRRLVNHLLEIQHDYQPLIISTQHIHLSHENCLEVLVLKGKPREVRELAELIKAAKGVRHVSVSVTAAEA